MHDTLTPRPATAAPHFAGKLIVKHDPRREEYVDAMGLTYVDVEIRRTVDDVEVITERMMVDSGATDSVVPADVLRDLGIKPVDELEYELADGSVVTFARAPVVMKLLGATVGTTVIFGPSGQKALLGVTVLESLGATIDPTTRTLTRRPTRL